MNRPTKLAALTATLALTGTALVGTAEPAAASSCAASTHHRTVSTANLNGSRYSVRYRSVVRGADHYIKPGTKQRAGYPINKVYVGANRVLKYNYPDYGSACTIVLWGGSKGKWVDLRHAADYGIWYYA